MTRYGAAVRVVGLSLLLLVLSPVTAPFSTCDLAALFGGAAQPGGVIVQSKTPLAEDGAELLVTGQKPPVEDLSAAAASGACHLRNPRTAHLIPLRI